MEVGRRRGSVETPNKELILKVQEKTGGYMNGVDIPPIEYSHVEEVIIAFLTLQDENII